METEKEPIRLWAQRFDATRERFEAVVAPLSEDQVRFQPGPGSWSVVECVEHMNVTAGLYSPLMAEVVRGGRQRGLLAQPPYKGGTWVGRLLLWSLNDAPAKKRKVKAPGIFQPVASELESARVWDGFRTQHQRWKDLLQEADGLDLGGLIFGTPISRWVRVSLAQAFEIHCLHEERHLGQAENVTRNEGFPPTR
jgi:hypothetical protein